MIDKDASIGFAIGFLVGATIGLGIGFLYAPRPGEETRKLVKEKLEEVTTEATGFIDRAQESSARAKYRQKWAQE